MKRGDVSGGATPGRYDLDVQGGTAAGQAAALEQRTSSGASGAPSKTASFTTSLTFEMPPPVRQPLSRVTLPPGELVVSAGARPKDPTAPPPGGSQKSKAGRVPPHGKLPTIPPSGRVTTRAMTAKVGVPLPTIPPSQSLLLSTASQIDAGFGAAYERMTGGEGVQYTEAPPLVPDGARFTAAQFLRPRSVESVRPSSSLSSASGRSGYTRRILPATPSGPGREPLVYDAEEQVVLSSRAQAARPLHSSPVEIQQVPRQQAMDAITRRLSTMTLAQQERAETPEVSAVLGDPNSSDRLQKMA